MSQVFAVSVTAAAFLLTACGDDGTASSATKPARATSKPPAAPPGSASPSPTRTLTPDTAADGRDLDACRDGKCEVVVKAGDVLRFGAKVKAKPRIDMITVLGAGEGKFALAMPSMISGPISGDIELNNALRIEIGESEGNRTAIRISRLR